MLRATLHIDLDSDYVLSELSDLADGPFVVSQCEVLDDDLIRFVIDAGPHRDAVERLLLGSDAVLAVEPVDDSQLLITKRSSGALPVIRENHGMLQRMSQFDGTRRVFDIVVFRRADLKAIVNDLRSLGHVRLSRLAPFSGPATTLSRRQAEVVSLALEEGYFDWPRRADATTLAARLDITHVTFLEHLRKAEQKLLTDALTSASAPVQSGVAGSLSSPADTTYAADPPRMNETADEDRAEELPRTN
ncbi:helix-turn-helix domain-containing protein [Haloprofundus salilacus]|uniref:helix-turn-helix domain-containing protein n=1 Tax=Haloprofundus salilacus TaxID=2876190 RepID=UPI001CCDDF3C|nr:helix-turn-helix domain-containing protein [Haloprofundus salilacus]